MGFLRDAFKSSFKEKPIKSLDGLRALSIILVILGHLSFTYTDYSTILANYFSLMQATGVSIFFVISGFLINGFLIKEKAQLGKVDLKLFYFKRLLRIFPPFYLYVFLMVFLLPFYDVVQPTQVEILSALSYLWNYIYSTKNWFFGHSWSLAIEEQFYMSWPFLLAFLSLSKSRKFSLVIFFLAPLIRVGSYYLFPDWRPRLSIMFHTRIDTLLFGCYLAYFYQFLSKEAFLSWGKKVRKYRGDLLAFLFLFMLSPYLKYKLKGSYIMTVGYTLEGVSIVFLLVSLLTLNSKNPLYQFLNSKVLCHLGILSYGLYLWQQFFLAHQIDFGNALLRLGYLYISVLIIYLLFEYPLGLLSKRWQKKYF